METPEDARCPVCNMMAAKFPAWNTQVLHEDGTRVFPETAGCMVSYYAVTEKFADTDSAIVGAWATEFETGERIDGRELIGLGTVIGLIFIVVGVVAAGASYLAERRLARKGRT